VTGCSGAQKNGFTYNYDPAGNMLSMLADLPTSATTTTYKYNEGDQLCWAYNGLSSNGCSSPPVGSITYSFEANGNQTAAGSRTFTWDLENRLLTTTGASTTHSYTYDGDGNRLLDSTGPGPSAQTKYPWDVNANLAQLVLERNGNNVLRRRYVYGGGLVSMYVPSTYHYYLTDLGGSVANVTSASGATEWTYTYNPFGDARSITKNDPCAPTNLMRFDAQLLDTADDLYYLRARMYSPSTARFLQLDPLSSPSTEPYVASYAYARNRPIVLSDASGMSPVEAFDEGPPDGTPTPPFNPQRDMWCEPATGTWWVRTAIFDPATGMWHLVTYDTYQPCDPDEEPDPGDDDPEPGDEEPEPGEEEEPPAAIGWQPGFNAWPRPLYEVRW
jgi:RHS repeat-associated protein